MHRSSEIGALVAAALLSACVSMGSIGANLGKQHADGRVVVRQVPSDMEAAKAGLQPGDEVLYIEGQDARTMSAEQVHQALVGPVGTTVQVTVARAGNVMRLTIRRGPLK